MSLCSSFESLRESGVFVRKAVLVLLVVSMLRPSAADETRDLRITPVVTAVRRAGPSVVNISTEQIIERPYNPFSAFADPFFEDFFRHFSSQFPRTSYRVHSLGSGIIISPDGFVITNEHVTRRASRITVTLADGREFDAEVLNSSSEVDLGVMKLNPSDPLPYAKMGDSSDLMIGETLIAVGNPFGLENSVTTGVLSATGRSLNLGGDIAYSNLLQTTALINPGNSGGPLLNLNAQVVGMNTAVKLDAQGIGFAIPINDIRDMLVQLLDFEFVKNTSLGVEVPHDPSAAVVVISVRPDAPGASAGIKPGDRIVEVDGHPIGGVLDYQMAVLRKELGDEVEMELLRDGGLRNVTAAIGEAPPPAGAEEVKRRTGAEVYPLSAYVARRLGVPTDFGVLVHRVQPGSPADSIGLSPQDVIILLGGKRIGTVPQLMAELDKVPAGGRMAIGVLRGGHLLEATFRVN